MSTSDVNLEKYLIPLDEINRATNNFSSKRKIGDGGFGAVYRGQLSELWQSRTVAVKRRDADSRQGWPEFRNEIELISKFHHENILAFIGYCDEGDEMIIVYEYVSNGSLDDHLRDPKKMRCISWAQRLEICIGAARGLHYLHSGLGEQEKVIHRDVKSANILLDDNMVAKICDFGLSKLGTRNQPDTRLYTKVAGTQFYMDPLYHESGILRKESDVYSFGVVLFEIFSGTPVYGGTHLMNVVRRYHQNEPDKVVDLCIRDQIHSRSLNTFKKIAYRCISMTLTQRPALDTVIKELKEALGIHLSSRARDSVIESIIGKLNSISPEDQRIAFREITFLAKHCDQNYVAFAKAGATPRLIHLITAPDSQTREQAMAALLNLSLYKDILNSSEVVLEVVHILEKGNNEAPAHALTILLNLSKNEDNNGIIISSGAVPGIVNILEKGNNEAREHALTIILNLSMNKDNRDIIISSGAVTGIVNILEKGSNEACENATAAIYNLSKINKAKVTIGSAGAIPPIVLLLSKGTTTGKMKAAKSLLNLCFNYDNKGRAVTAGLVPILVELLKEPQGVLKEESVELLYRLSEDPEGKLAIGEVEVVPHLVELLGTGTQWGNIYAVTVLLNLCCMDEKYLVEAQEHGVMGKLEDLRQGDYRLVHRPATELQRMIKDHQHVDSYLVAISKRGVLQICSLIKYCQR